MVKAKKESVMGKLGDSPYEDPMEPWSGKYNAPVKNEEVESLDEDTWLFAYIRSLGYNPKVMDFAQRSKYARSNAFKHWKQSHMERRAGETATMEETELVNEAGTGLLMTFIKAKGLNPLTMDGNQKHAYSRSSEFRVFKQKHQKEQVQETSGMGERGDDWNEETGGSLPMKKKKLKKAWKKLKEELDKADTVTMDIPLLIRVLEYAREDAKTDMDLHKVVENLIKMRDQGALSMSQYDAIVKITEDIQKLQELKKMPDNMDIDDHITREEKKMKGTDPCWKGYQMVGTKKKGARTVPNCVPEEVELQEEFKKGDRVRHNDGTLGTVTSGPDEQGIVQWKHAGNKHRASHKDVLKSAAGEKFRWRQHQEEVVSESMPSGVTKIKQKYADMSAKEFAQNHGHKKDDELRAMAWRHGYGKNSNYYVDKKREGQGASKQVQEGIGNVEDSPQSATNSVKAMESAHRDRQMKSARMIKSLYKNKIKETTYDWEKDDKPNAKIVVKGGTTMTGQPRDTVEIEPVLKTRPNQQKPTV